jgi:N-acyl-D-aspartate/D-glutamate deacylase
MEGSMVDDRVIRGDQMRGTRERGLYRMGEAIRRLTSAPARVVGLGDRGTLAPGLRADVNVFDPDAVAECQPELVHDFPGGAPRYIQRCQRSGQRARRRAHRHSRRNGPAPRELTGIS